MKKLMIPISFCFAMVLFTSCAARVAYVDRSESVSTSSGFGSIVPSESFKSTSKIEASSASLNQSFTGSSSGFLVGIYFTDIELGDKFEVQPEVDFILVKDLNEIQVPVLVKYNIAEAFSVLAGPNVGFLLDAPTGLKSFNYGIDLGAAYDINDKFNVNARYGFGLADLSENSFSEIKLSGFQIGLGYQF